MKKRLIKRRRTRQELRDLAGRFRNSGMGIWAFCRQEQVAYATLRRWLERDPDRPRLLEVVPAQRAPTGFVLHTADGHSIDIDYQFPAEALMRLLRAIRS